MTVRREIVEPRRETSARSPEDPMHTRAVCGGSEGRARWPSSVSDNLGIGNTNLVYRWKAEQVSEGGPVAESLDSEVRELQDELRRTQRERDILKKALGILSQQE